MRSGGAIFGILVFLGGVALIGYAFMEARELFLTTPPSLPDLPPPVAATPAPPMDSPTPSPPADGASAGNEAINIIAGSVADFVKRLLALFVMCLAGSFVASRGVELFFRSLAASPDAGKDNRSQPDRNRAESPVSSPPAASTAPTATAPPESS
ncbi:MAG: hypothetical protein OHK0029_30390 [Armatimonadaceae bacterium]